MIIFISSTGFPQSERQDVPESIPLITKARNISELYISSKMTPFLRLAWGVDGALYKELDSRKMEGLKLVACYS